jgi:hypothetical protein
MLKQADKQLQEIRKELAWREAGVEGEKRIRDKYAGMFEAVVDDKKRQIEMEIKERSKATEEECRNNLLALLELGDQ